MVNIIQLLMVKVEAKMVGSILSTIVINKLIFNNIFCRTLTSFGVRIKLTGNPIEQYCIEWVKFEFIDSGIFSPMH